ncbi:MAG: hypothetical protein ABIE74_01355 [Pseudomonadota bacterium]
MDPFVMMTTFPVRDREHRRYSRKEQRFPKRVPNSKSGYTKQSQDLSSIKNGTRANRANKEQKKSWLKRAWESIKNVFSKFQPIRMLPFATATAGCSCGDPLENVPPPTALKDNMCKEVSMPTIENVVLKPHVNDFIKSVICRLPKEIQEKVKAIKFSSDRAIDNMIIKGQIRGSKNIYTSQVLSAMGLSHLNVYQQIAFGRNEKGEGIIYLSAESNMDKRALAHVVLVGYGLSIIADDKDNKYINSLLQAMVGDLRS